LDILARSHIGGIVFHRFVVHAVEDGSLDAEAFGETINPGRHPLGTPVKTVPSHRLSVRRTRNAWEATLAFDT